MANLVPIVKKAPINRGFLIFKWNWTIRKIQSELVFCPILIPSYFYVHHQSWLSNHITIRVQFPYYSLIILDKQGEHILCVNLLELQFLLSNKDGNGILVLWLLNLLIHQCINHLKICGNQKSSEYCCVQFCSHEYK